MTPSIRSLLGIESATAELDPAGLGEALGTFAVSVAGNPAVFALSVLKYGMRSAQAAMTATLRGMGVDRQGPAELADDPRFADPSWTSNPLFWLVRQQYTLLEAFARDLLTEADLDELTRRKADFALRQALDAAAPTNWLATNPVALKKAFETGGLSLVR
ncbi:MAG: hypothetical protein ACRDQX_08620, partial [Pseudonocardiaceae bacterium]